MNLFLLQQKEQSVDYYSYANQAKIDLRTFILIAQSV